MLYLCLAMVIDVAIFTMGLTMSIIDVNRYNFGLYLVLMSVVAFSLLVALWVAKPKFCRTPNWAIQIYLALVKSSTPNYQTAAGEDETLIHRQNADDIIRSIKGIPFLIQAIQYSLEAAYVSPPPESTSAGATVTDSAIDSLITSHDYCPQLTIESGDEQMRSTSATVNNSGNDEKKNGGRGRSQTASCHRVQQGQRRRVADLKRQSIFVVFPYSETLPIEQTKLKMRRSSSEHELDRKSSFEQFCTAVISGQNRRESKISSSESRLELSDRLKRSKEQKMADEEHATTKLDTARRSPQVRRPSLEVRYVGLQGILLAKMNSKHKNDHGDH